MKYILTALLLLLLAAGPLPQTLQERLLAASTLTITVTTTADSFDVTGKTCADVADVDLPGVDGQTSLREALCASNNTLDSNPHFVAFQIDSGARVIQPASSLPEISYSVIVDGTTQPGYGGRPLIVLDGSAAGTSANGLWIKAGSSTIRGLNIQNFAACAILITENGGNLIENNTLGVNLSGDQARPNEAGVVISGASANIIQNNLISGNRAHGVYIEWVSATDNIVRGNRIGTDARGALAVGNLQMGVYLANTLRTVIGGDQPGDGNLISGNQINVYIARGLEGEGYNQVLGNFIGTNISGTVALGGVNYPGIYLAGSVHNLIGGSQASCGLAGDPPGAVLPDHPACPGNLISGNGKGISITGSNNQVLGNFIGTDRSGTKDMGNREEGIYIEGGPDNQIGGSQPGDGNLISGNDTDGILVASYIDGPQAARNQVEGNRIGTDITGSQALGNTACGIYIEHAPFTRIGGSEAGAGNLISGNACGIIAYLQLHGAEVQGNRIGTDLSGRQAIGNRDDGIIVGESLQVTIGGSAPGQGNIISGNGRYGIYISGHYYRATNTVIAGNLIGVDETGGGKLGNTLDGVYIQDSHSVLVGGSLASGGNQIAGNGRHGIFLDHSANITVTGNLIGTIWNGKLDLGNAGSGIRIEASSGNRVGGASQEGNLIAYNGQSGVVVLNGALVTDTLANTIHANAIFSNQGLGIDLGGDGVTPNDPGDPDVGPNLLQNYPLITGADAQTPEGKGRIWFRLSSIPSASYTLSFYLNPACAPVFGEYQEYLGDIQVATGADGQVAAWMETNSPLPLGWYITATATDAGGNTSEFSACTPVAEWLQFYLPVIRN